MRLKTSIIKDFHGAKIYFRRKPEGQQTKLSEEDTNQGLTEYFSVCFRCLVIVVLSGTVCVNVMFIMDVNHKLKEEGLDDSMNSLAAGGDSVDLTPRALTIEVFSSHSKVSVIVDGTVVSSDPSSSSHRVDRTS